MFTKSELGARSRGSDRCAAKISGDVSSAHGELTMHSANVGAIHESPLRIFTRRILAAHISPGLSSTWRFIRIFFEKHHQRINEYIL